jgi:CRP-like cAMP-binding protein
MRTKAKAAFDPKKFLAKAGEGKTVSSYRKDQIVYSQGEVADAVFYIQQGNVKLTVVSEQGKEAVVAIVGPGHFFGEGCLNGHPLRIATTRAVDDDCVVTRLEKATMLATIHKRPEFSELFMSYLLTRNSRIEEDLTISCSIRAKSVSPGFSFSLQISARKAGRSRSWESTVRRCWRK